MITGAQITAACGKPTRQDFRSIVPGGPAVNTLSYGHIALTFDGATDEAHLTGAMRRGQLLSDTATRTALPCLNEVKAAVREQNYSAAGTHNLIAVEGLAVLGGLLTGFGIPIVIIAIYIQRRKAWTNRPRRLCTNCYMIRQPLKMKSGEFYCPVCQRSNPIPLESPVAQHYLIRTQEQHRPLP